MGLLALAAVWLVVPRVGAGVVTWDVDPAASYIRLTLPDQTVNVTNVGDITVRIRDANSTSQWTDAGGRRAAIDGEIVSDYVDGVSVRFLGGQHNLYAIEATNLRPNPAKWSPATTNYTDSSTAPAALGGRVRASLLLTFDAAFVAFRSVQLDITNAIAGVIPITNGVFAGGTTVCGIAAAWLDVDGVELPLGLGQPIPDLRNERFDSVMQPNAAGGTIANLGGRNRKLTYTIDIDTTLDLGGSTVSGSAAGVIVAYATLPEPPPPPTLTVRLQGTNVILAWATNAAGFVLESATALPPTNWLPAAPPPVVVDGQNVVTNRTTLDAAFYRLRGPQ